MPKCFLSICKNTSVAFIHSNAEHMIEHNFSPVYGVCAYHLYHYEASIILKTLALLEGKELVKVL